MSLHNVPTEYYLPVSELTKKPGLDHSSLRRASGVGGGIGSVEVSKDTASVL